MVTVSWVELQSLLKTFGAWKGWMSLVRCSVRNERPEDPPGAVRGIHQLAKHPLEVKNSKFFTWKKKVGKEGLILFLFGLFLVTFTRGKLAVKLLEGKSKGDHPQNPLIIALCLAKCESQSQICWRSKSMKFFQEMYIFPFPKADILVKSLNRQASRRPCEWRRRCVAAAAGVSMRRYSNAWICTSLYTCVVDTCSRLVTKIAGKGYDCIKIVSEEMLGFYKCIEMAYEWTCLVRGCVQCLLSQNPAKVLIVEIHQIPRLRFKNSAELKNLH